MSDPIVPKPRRLAWWLVIAGVWTLFAVLSAVQEAFHSAYLGRMIEWRALLPIRLADWYTCALFTPVCFWLVRRFPLQRGVWLRNASVQLSVMSAAVALKFALYVELAKRISPSPRWQFGEVLARGFISETIAFWALLGVVHGIEYHRNLREREMQAVRLEAELASARLDALTAQLQPHFLFNTLNSISTLMRRDVDAAEEMLAHLGDLLHRTLRHGDRHEVTLAEERALLQHYLDIMQIRFQDRLQIRVQIDEGLSGALVPPLVLQPIVENAIRHGISRRPGAGLLEISARAEGESLEIAVRDDGEGMSAGVEGIGISNTRRRLRQLYGDAQALDFAPAEGGGLRVTLRMPLRCAPAAA